MNPPNDEGIIYFGTRIENIIDIDCNGLRKPINVNEEYISVSISGYVGQLTSRNS